MSKYLFIVCVLFWVGQVQAQISGPNIVCPGTSTTYELDPGWRTDAQASYWSIIGGVISTQSTTSATVIWNANATQRQLTISVEYLVVTYDGDGFPTYEYNTLVYNFQVEATPLEPSAVIPSSLCNQGSVTLTASGGQFYRWYDSNQNLIPNQTSNQYTPFVSVNSDFYVSVVNSLGCDESTRKRIQVHIERMPNPASGSFSSCGPGNVNLVVYHGLDLTGVQPDRIIAYVRWYDQPAGGNYLYQSGVSPNSSNPAYTTYVAANTTFYASNFNPNTNCESDRVPLTVTVKVLPQLVFGISDIEACSGQTITPTYNTNIAVDYFEIQSSNDPWISGVLQSSNSLSHVLVNNGAIDGWVHYTVIPFSNGCAGMAKLLNVKVKPIPVASASPTQICSGQSANIALNSVVEGTNFSWTVSAPNITGATSGSGTTITQSLTNVANSNQTATYTITPIANGCAGSSVATTVTVKPLPNVAVSLSSQSICTGQPMASVTIINPNAVSGTTFSWTVSAPNITGATAGSGTTLLQTLTNATSTNQTATYTITPTANGCAGTPATHTVTVKPTPTAAVSLASQSICTGQPMASVTITNPNVVSGTTFNWTVTAPNITGATAGSGTTLLQTLTNATSTNQTATYTITPTANGCAGTPATHTVTVKPTPTAAVSLASQSICTGQPMASVTITNPNAVSGTTFSWMVSAPNITGATAGSGTTLIQTLTNTTNVNQTAIYTIIPTASGCTGAAVVHSVTVKPIPTLSSLLNPLPIASGSTFDYTATSSVVGATFTWSRALVAGIAQSPSNGSGNVSEILVNNTTADVTVNYLFVTAANGCSSSSQSVSVIVQAPVVVTQNENYIITNTLLEPQTDVNVVENLLVNQRSQSFQYFDGLGRPMQTVSTQGSPNKKDIVQTMAYDAFGRESKKYLPYVAATSTDGWYKPNALRDPQSTFTDPEALYRTGAQWQFYQSATKVAGDTRPYTETIFEPSPLSRPSQEFGAGENWKDNNKFIQHQYLINVHGTLAGQEQIIAWKVDATGLPIRETAVNAAVSGGYYLSAQLNIKSTKDEQGNEVREYVDKEGQTILKKVQAVTTPVLNTPAHWTSTYYIYDDLGNLRYVLQPELSKTLLGSATANPTQQQLNNLAFQYKYDGRRRMTEKKVPGAGWVYMVYDNRDRLVLTQEGNQRSGTPATIKYWSFTKYDELNRPILTGIKDTTIASATVLMTQADMQAVVNNYYLKASARWSETYVGNVAGNVHGYTNRAYPVRTGSTTTEIDHNKYLSATYYDNYSFRSLWVGNYTYLDESLSETVNGVLYSQPTVENLQVIGQVTGTKTKVLDGGVRGGFTWLKSVSYYDDKYRTVQTISDNYKGGTERSTNVIDFVGRVLQSKATHLEADLTWTSPVSIQMTGNFLRSTATTSGAASIQQLAAGQNGWIEAIYSENNTTRFFGLNDSNPDAASANINYAFRFTTSNTVNVVENSTTKATITGVASGDVFRITRTGTAVTYTRNGNAITLSPASTASTTLLMADLSLTTNNATLVGLKSSFSTTTQTITRRFEYDHAGRLLKTWHSLNGASPLLLTQNEYNEVGQLVDKKLHSANNGTSFKQSVDYRYNIRGWLRSMNNSQLTVNSDNDEAGDFFGMELGYNTGIGSGNTFLFNGNISGIKWSKDQALGTVKDVAYNYTYDPLNRILSASYLNNTAGSWANSTGAFNESGYSYDQNGNINALTRKGATGANMDLLAYNYGTVGNVAYGNQLLKVGDTGDKTTGFIDGANTTNDFAYDANGNMTTDQNKGITGAIAYNYLNLPELITRGTSNTIRYIYDAGGRKLAQVASYNSAQKQTEYMGEFQYENDVLQHIMHEEGRVVVSNTENQYTNSGDNTTNITGTNTTMALVTQNGTQTYIKATSSGIVARTGITFTTLNVTAGERYIVRAKGYRDKGTSTTSNPVYLSIKANGVDQGWPGATLASSVATEAWTEQIVTVPAGATTLLVGVAWNTTVTAGEVFFVNDVEINKIAATAPEYQYNLKDHLGNVRVTFTTKDETVSDVATYEAANINVEQSKFLRYATAKRINATIFDRTNGAATGYSQRLNGSTNEKYGLAKSISVMPGDVINAEVYAKYVDPVSSNWTGALSTLMTQIAANTAGVVIDGISYSNSTSSFPTTYGGLQGKTDNGAPKAYLNWLIFDRNYVFQTGGFKQITTAGKEAGTDVPHEYLASPTITITQPGYVYIYLSNESAAPVEVYFDDFKVTQTKSPVIASNDYYPFGLTFNSYSRENSVPNKFKFQEQEHIDDLGLNWDSFKWRNHQPDIGRFFNVDPLAEKYVYWSPYAFSGNQVVNARELEGLEPYVVTGRSFIPSKTVSNPMPFSNTKSFKGDDRSFDPKATSYRTEQKVRVDFDNKKVSLLNNTASGSTGLDSKGNVTETSAAGKAGPTPTYDKGAMEKGSTTINMQVDATNELATGAPAINYDVNITITPQEDGSVNYNMTGASDGFPAYEFYITDEATGKSTMMHGSNPQKTGDTPYSLFPPMEKTINKSGNTNDKKKPE